MTDAPNPTFYGGINFDNLVKSRHSCEGRIQIFCKGSKTLDPGLRRDDEKRAFPTSYETINV
jgi:hypothetical protein